MKALLYRKFVSGKTELLIMAVLFAVSAALWLATEEMFISFVTFTAACTGVLVRSISEGEKAGWDSYSRALPVSVYERVGARYIFWVTVLLMPMLLYGGLEFVAVMNDRVGVNGAPEQVAEEWFSSSFYIYIIYFLTFMVASSFALPISYAIKRGGVRSMIIALPFIPAALSLFLLVVIDILGGYNNLINAMDTLTFIVLSSVTALLAYGASYCVSVIFEAKTEREKLKPVKAAAAVLTAAAVAMSGVSFWFLYESDVFVRTGDSLFLQLKESENRREEFEGKYSSDATTAYYGEIPEETTKPDDTETRLLMTDIVDGICGKTFADKRIKEVEEMFGEMGCEELLRVGSKNSGYTPAEIRIFGEYGILDAGYPDRINITADIKPTVIVYPDSYDSNDDADKKHAEIMELFKVGTKEEEAVEHMKKLGLCPYEISEILKSGIPFRTYRFEIEYFSEYKNAKKPARMLEIDLLEGRICSIR